MTTWILRSRVDSCTDKWKAVMTGRDHFTRQEQRAGPRAHRNTHTPLVIFYSLPFTARKRCGKVMFSQMSAILLGGGGRSGKRGEMGWARGWVGRFPIPMKHWDMGTPTPLPPIPDMGTTPHVINFLIVLLNTKKNYS